MTLHKTKSSKCVFALIVTSLGSGTCTYKKTPRNHVCAYQCIHNVPGYLWQLACFSPCHSNPTGTRVCISALWVIIPLILIPDRRDVISLVVSEVSSNYLNVFKVSLHAYYLPVVAKLGAATMEIFIHGCRFYKTVVHYSLSAETP